jgi:2-hydroxychromene-2-carboxylate isomerase
MGQVVYLAQHRARHSGAGPDARRERPRVELHFELSCPFTYFAAERVDRAFEAVEWIPVSRAAATPGARSGQESLRRLRHAAEARAYELRMPLIWPDSFPADVPATMRVAAYAAACGHGAEFALAAGRLAFCGGFDLEDPEIIAEAAAAAGLGLDSCLAAARDSDRDDELEAAGRRLRAAGADELPALRLGRALYCGEGRVAEAAAAAHARPAAPRTRRRSARTTRA